MSQHPANPYGAADIAGLPAQPGQPAPVSVSGLVVTPNPVQVAANTSTPIPLGVPQARQITIQNNTTNPIYRSYSGGQASFASLVIPAGVQQIDTVSSGQLYLFGTVAFGVNSGINGVVVEVYS